MIRLLLEEGVNPNTKNPSDQTALHMAINFRYELLINMPLEMIAKWNIVGNSALHLASNESVVKLLLKYGADPNLLNLNRESSLKLVEWFRDFYMIGLLLKHGAR